MDSFIVIVGKIYYMIVFRKGLLDAYNIRIIRIMNEFFQIINFGIWIAFIFLLIFKTQSPCIPLNDIQTRSDHDKKKEEECYSTQTCTFWTKRGESEGLSVVMGPPLLEHLTYLSQGFSWIALDRESNFISEVFFELFNHLMRYKGVFNRGLF